jgi:hypothetical protein
LPYWNTAPPATAHPKIAELHDYWRRLAPAPGMLPARRQIDPVDIPGLLANLWLADVVGEPPRFRFRLIGGAMERIGVAAAKGDFFDRHVPDDCMPMRQFRFVVAERQPVWFRGPAFLPHRAKMFELERLTLPLAGDGATVDTLLTITVFYMPDGQQI